MINVEKCYNQYKDSEINDIAAAILTLAEVIEDKDFFDSEWSHYDSEVSNSINRLADVMQNEIKIGTTESVGHDICTGIRKGLFGIAASDTASIDNTFKKENNE